MEWWFIIKTTTAVLALFAAMLNANSVKWGFLIWACTDFAWIIIDYHHDNYQHSITSAVYVIIDLCGFYKFSKREHVFLDLLSLGKLGRKGK